MRRRGARNSSWFDLFMYFVGISVFYNDINPSMCSRQTLEEEARCAQLLALLRGAVFFFYYLVGLYHSYDYNYRTKLQNISMIIIIAQNYKILSHITFTNKRMSLAIRSGFE
ncbi:hypothetical protein T492DRAFT_911830 [Pavlovales sp. CCMP2436]|nr:hypothetical protein T492DRAFT_911830 [Pavlovales sp. CCMP2436]